MFAFVWCPLFYIIPILILLVSISFSVALLLFFFFALISLHKFYDRRIHLRSSSIETANTLIARSYFADSITQKLWLPIYDLLMSFRLCSCMVKWTFVGGNSLTTENNVDGNANVKAFLLHIALILISFFFSKADILFCLFGKFQPYEFRRFLWV